MRKYPYFDSHCDTLMKIFPGSLSLRDASCDVNISNMSGYRHAVQVFAVYNDGTLTENDTIAAFSYMGDQCRLSRRHIGFASSTYGIRSNVRFGRATAIYAIESVGNQPDFSLESIERYKNAGVRFISLSWNNDNILCGGSDRNRRGLTPLGKQAVKAVEENGIILDVSHMSERSFWQAMDIYTMPPVATHSNSRAVCPHNRNITDEQFRLIVQRDGVCGINFYPPHLGGDNPGIDNVISHIEHFMSLGGENNIGIGGDFDGIDMHCHDLINSACTYKLFDTLLSLNYKESTVNKIAFYNFYNLMRKFEIRR